MRQVSQDATKDLEFLLEEFIKRQDKVTIADCMGFIRKNSRTITFDYSTRSENMVRQIAMNTLNKGVNLGVLITSGSGLYLVRR